MINSRLLLSVILLLIPQAFIRSAEILSKQQLNQELLSLYYRDAKVAQVLDLINKGADVNATNEYGDIPLHLAALVKNTNIVKFLLNNGADVNARNIDNRTPLHFAVLGDIADQKMKNIVGFLLIAGADINAEDKHGKTPLHYAIQFHTKEKNIEKIVKILLYAGADIYIQDNEGDSAIKYSQSDAIDKLIKQKGYEDYVKNVKKTREGTGIYIPILEPEEWSKEVFKKMLMKKR